MLILIEKEANGIRKVKVMANVVQKDPLYRDTQRECQLL